MPKMPTTLRAKCIIVGTCNQLINLHLNNDRVREMYKGSVMWGVGKKRKAQNVQRKTVTGKRRKISA